jgi:hypothetical protein
VATVQERVEVFTGSLTTYSAQLAQVLSDTVSEVIGLLPTDALTTLWDELTDSGSGVDTSNVIVIEARKGLVPAQQINPSLRTTAVATDSRPFYYTWKGNSYVIPNGGTILAITAPAIVPSSTTVTNVPEALMTLIVIRTAVNMLAVIASSSREGVSTTVTIPTAPTPPSAPAIAYTDAVIATPSVSSIAALPTAPVYSAPTLAAKGTAPTVATLDLTTKVDGATALTPPTMPSTPTFSFSDATAATVGTISIGSLPAPPSYSAPSFGGSAAVPTLPDLDLTTKIDGATALTIPSPPAAPTLSSAGQASVSIDFTLPDAAVPSYTKPSATASLDFANWTTYFGKEDPAMMAEAVRKLTAELDEIQAGIAEENSSFSGEIEVYRAKVQKAIATAQIEAQEKANELSATDQMTLQNYIQSLVRFDKQIAEYEASVTSQLQVFKSELEKAVTPWVESNRTYLEKYSLDIKAASEAFAVQIQDHLKECDRVLDQAKVDSQRVVVQAELATNVSIQNELNTVKTAIDEYASSIQLAQIKTELYKLETDAKVALFTTGLDRSIRLYEVLLGIDVSRYDSEQKNATVAFQQSLAVYESGVQRNALQAEIARQEQALIASTTTDLNLANEARTLEAAISDYQSNLGLFSGTIQSYGQQVMAATEGGKTRMYLTRERVRMLDDERNRLAILYETNLRAYLKKYTHRRQMTAWMHDF